MSQERIIELGEERFGILTEPSNELALRPAVVLPNIGLVHRIGPFRQQVQLARHLAALGHPVLRFDLPGIGDSPRSTKPPAAVVASVLDRLDQLKIGAGGYIVGGICYAADVGWNLAICDNRVRGMLMIDGVARPGSWFRVGQSKLFLGRPASSWAGMLMRRFSAQETPSEEQFRDWPQAGDEPAQLATLVARGVRVLALYTGGVAHYFLHPRQFESTFGDAAKHPLVEFEFWPECDHLVMAQDDRVRLQQRIGDWSQQVKPL